MAGKAGKSSKMGVVRLGGRDEARRPFWLHQLAEYLLGLALVAQGVQSPTPTVPALAGGLVVLNAALVDGPLGAFPTVPRRVHRWCDVAVIGVLVALAAVPFLGTDGTSRLLLAGVAAVLAVVWWNTRFEPTVRPGRDRGTDVAGMAGRAVGSVVRAARHRRPGD